MNFRGERQRGFVCVGCDVVAETVPGKWTLNDSGLELSWIRCPKCGATEHVHVQALMEDEVERLDPWASAVLLPYKRKPVDRRIEDAFIVGCDTESQPEDFLNPKGKPYTIQKPLCWTFAWKTTDGTTKTDRWDVEDKGPVRLGDLEDHVREVTGVRDRPIYLVAFWAIAELRNISDLKSRGRNHLKFIHDDTVHVNTESLKIIDAFAYFAPLGLDAVAQFAGLKKVHPDTVDGNPWDAYVITNMRWLKHDIPKSSGLTRRVTVSRYWKPSCSSERYGIVAIDCSWEKAEMIFMKRFRGANRKLPALLAANPVNYAKIGKLSTAEALCAALFIRGFHRERKNSHRRSVGGRLSSI